MATNTTKLALTKPDGTDLVDIAVLNANADKIDAASGATICTSTTRPASPWNGQVIFETDTLNALVYRTATSSWTTIGGSTVSATPPTTAGSGNLWWDSDNGKLYIYYSDGNSSQWVAVIPGSGANPAATNILLNSGFDIWQRGTSLAQSGGGTGADMWRQYTDSGSGTQTKDTVDYPAGVVAQSYKFTAGANSTNWSIFQIIESIHTIPLAGATVTFSAYIKSNIARTIKMNYTTSTTNDTGWAGTWATPTSTNQSVTTSWARYSVTFVVPSNAKTLQVGFGSNGNDFASGASVNVAGVQLEVNPQASAYKRNQPNIQAELAACQRYYWRVNGKTGTETVSPTVVGISTVSGSCGIQFPVSMRAATTVGFSALYANSYTGTNGVITSISVGTGTDSTRVTFTGSSWTSGMNYIVQGSGSTSYLDFSAEL